MEDFGDHRIRVVRPVTAVTAVTAVAAVLLMAQPTVADHHEPIDWPVTATVETNPEAVTVEAGVSNSVGGGSGGQVSSSGSNCRLEATNIGASLSQEFWDRPANELPFFLWCDGQIVGLVWVAIAVSGPPLGGPNPEEIAMKLRDRIPIPNVTIGVNPERGLVGVESWFWIEGYTGRPITESTNAFGRRIEVEARVERYAWSFGDDGRLRTGTLGRPYPERSDVRHVYERTSLGYEKGYPVEVAFFFSVRYRVEGGGWIELPGIERFAEASYQVRESQAVIRR
jgi:hypothetical protein